MRVSRLLLVTLRDVPAEAEITSHQLLLRAGYIRRVGSGIYAYLPLMWRVLQKITAVVREEMNRAGAQETMLPQLCLLYTSPSPRDGTSSRMPSSA